MPYLPTERARRDAVPAVEDERPLVLTRPVGSSLVVEQVCSRGRQLGLRPGLSLGQAQALAPGLAALAYEPHCDRVALERLARWALRFSPLVEPVEPDTLLIDITGCAALRRRKQHRPPGCRWFGPAGLSQSGRDRRHHWGGVRTGQCRGRGVQPRAGGAGQCLFGAVAAGGACASSRKLLRGWRPSDYAASATC